MTNEPQSTPDATASAKQRVLAVYPDARVHTDYQSFTDAVIACGVRSGGILLGFARKIYNGDEWTKAEEDAWIDAASKLPTPTATESDCVLCGTSQDRHYDGVQCPVGPDTWSAKQSFTLAPSVGKQAAPERATCRRCKRGIQKDEYGLWRDGSKCLGTDFLSETCNYAPAPLGRQMHEPAEPNGKQEDAATPTEEQVKRLRAWPVADGWMVASIDEYISNAKGQRILIPGITICRVATLELAAATLQPPTEPTLDMKFSERFLREVAKEDEPHGAGVGPTEPQEEPASEDRVKAALKMGRRATRDLRTMENGGVCPDCNREKWFCLCNQRDDGYVKSQPEPQVGELPPLGWETLRASHKRYVVAKELFAEAFQGSDIQKVAAAYRVYKTEEEAYQKQASPENILKLLAEVIALREQLARLAIANLQLTSQFREGLAELSALREQLSADSEKGKV